MYIKIENFICKKKGWNLGPQMRAYIGCIYIRFNFNFALCLCFNGFKNVVGCNDGLLLRVVKIENIKN